ncbi:MAG TPA: ABC transporter ATP-binding protein [Xanthobacteraceae bacterium]|nr:ABC transporter ATP-binding protein [Xanthobacteraceae bacterium]
MTEALSIRGLRAGYGPRTVIGGLSISGIEPGQIVSLVGPNAAGKSTLLRAIAGLIAAEGEVDLAGRNLLAISQNERSKFVAFMPQSLPQGANLIVLEAVISALSASAPAMSHETSFGERAVRALNRVGLSEQTLEPLERLSGGQRQLVGIAQAIVRNPRILLLDEPTSALDLRNQLEIMSVIRGLADEGHMIVAVMHDLALAARWSDRTILLHQGRIVADGTPAETITTENLALAYQVEARVERCSGGFLQVIADRPSAHKGRE